MALAKLAGILMCGSSPFLLFYFGSTFIWPDAFATAFRQFGDIAPLMLALCIDLYSLAAAL